MTLKGWIVRLVKNLYGVGIWKKGGVLPVYGGQVRQTAPRATTIKPIIRNICEKIVKNPRGGNQIDREILENQHRTNFLCNLYVPYNGAMKVSGGTLWIQQKKAELGFRTCRHQKNKAVLAIIKPSRCSLKR
ncbi:MAG TPA: hypothetical protein DCP92_09375 [Nitrospiraceae bacterium]|jgi:hypothetical protein|nr:hypothetical protein [Nitrospiraceae bacterium]